MSFELGDCGVRNSSEPREGFFPNLLVISDILPEQTLGGSLVLFRLLGNYPSNKILVVGKSHGAPGVYPPRLDNVSYHNLHLSIPRYLLMRINPWWPIMMIPASTGKISIVKKLISGFNPDAVLSVVCDFMCFLAAAVARDFSIPLHLFCHDDWSHQQTIRHRRWTKQLGMTSCDWALRGLFRQAASIQCVSKGMVENYQKRYGVKPDLLIPCRGNDLPTFELDSKSKLCGQPVIAYAGSIHYPWIARSLNIFAELIGSQNGYLDVYTPQNCFYSAVQWGLISKAARFKGFHSPDEFAKSVSATANALVLPASFDPADRLDVSTLFPSKLVDYTAIGLPIITWGPEYSTAVRWVMEHPGSAELVVNADGNGLLEAIVRVCEPSYGARIGLAGKAAGDVAFNLDNCRKKFIGLLRQYSKKN